MTCEIYCGDSCDWVFGNISVWPTITGGSRVDWALHPQFRDLQPHVFYLQFGRTGTVSADDWINVGSPVVDGFYAVDTEKRVYGRRQWTHYRIQLETDDGTYVSTPRSLYGNLGKRYWNIAKEIERKELLRLKNDAGQRGFLLKRRLFGEECSCLDTQTKEIRNPQCPLCYGTGFARGYYSPVPCVYAELQPHGHRSHLDGNGRGTVDDQPTTAGRFLARPQLFSYDVWVDKDSDMRWRVHEFKHLVEIQGYPVVVQAELRLIPYSDPVYSIEMPQTDDYTPWLPTPPEADFSADVMSGAAPLVVVFSDETTYDVHAPTSWLWDFGDGNTGTEQNPEHTYASAGTYTVVLTATNIHGDSTATQVDLISAT